MGSTLQQKALSSEPLLQETIQVQGSNTGPLVGKTFVSKDIFDVRTPANSLRLYICTQHCRACTVHLHMLSPHDTQHLCHHMTKTVVHGHVYHKQGGHSNARRMLQLVNCHVVDAQHSAASCSLSQTTGAPATQHALQTACIPCTTLPWPQA
jgi:hypothetical protein